MLISKYKSSLLAVCLAAMVGMGMLSACGQDDIQDEISEPIDSATMFAQTDSGEKSEEDKKLLRKSPIQKAPKSKLPTRILN